MNHVVRFVNTTTGIITTVAGTGNSGSILGGGNPLLAELSNPLDVEFSNGAVFIADTFNERVLQIDMGIINVVAGTGIAGYSGEGLLSNISMLNSPTSLHFLDAAGCILIADSGNDIIRKVCGSDMLMYTVAGTHGSFSYTGDGGLATGATLNNPTGVAYDSARDYILIADTSNNAVRFIINSTGIINTLAGTGTDGYSGDGGIANSATLSGPSAVVAYNSQVYVADTGNNRLRRASNDNNIYHYAGNGFDPFVGDGMQADASPMFQPMGGAMDNDGKAYITDMASNMIKVVDIHTNIINTLAGTGAKGFFGESVAASSAVLNAPQGIVYSDKRKKIF